MTKKSPYNTLTLRLAITAIAIFLLNIISKGSVKSLLELQPERVIVGGEYWRILSYPTMFQDGFSLTMFVVAMIVFGGSLEQLWNSRRLAASFAGIILVQGALWLLMPFNGQPPALCGAESLTFFVLSSAFWLYPQRFITLLGRYGIHTQAAIFALMMLSLGSIGFAAIAGDHATFLQRSFQSTLGVLSGLGATFVYQRYKASKRTASKKSSGISTDVVQDPEYHLAPATHSVPQLRQQPDRFAAEDYSDEDRLNMILDAIFERGYDSLLPEEKEFLDRYSRNLR